MMLSPTLNVVALGTARTITAAFYERNMTLYGLSLGGALSWFAGFPNSYGSANLAVTAVLQDSSGETLGSKRFEASERAVEWLYYSAIPVYTRAMVRAYDQISPGLRDFVHSVLTESNARVGAE
jgi:hypothetical protein